MTPEQAQEYRQEAARMAQLPKVEQAAYLAWQRDIAGNPRLKKADRDAARERANVLNRLLRKQKRK